MMRRSALPFLLLALTASACAERPEPPRVPVSATAKDIEVLGGSWQGEFWSESGKSGPIRFTLTAEEGEAIARGDVTVLGRPIRDGLRPANATAAPVSDTLDISFVSVDASTETVSGTMEPYRDPDCDCIVTTTFTGRISRDRIRGTFLTRGGAAYVPRVGGWEVRKVRSETER